jgi:hypothetical protein
MAISGIVSQAVGGSPLVFTDTSTGITVTSRSLSVFDANNVLVQTYNMGSNLTQAVPITSDVYYSFVLTLNGSLTITVNYMSTRFYDLQALTLEQALDCDCSCSKSLCNDAIKAMMSKDWAETYFIFGQSANAQRCITAANTLIASSSICNC